MNWKGKRAMRVDGKYKRLENHANWNRRELMRSSTPVPTSWCLNSKIVHSGVAAPSGQRWGWRPLKSETTEIRDKNGSLRESSWARRHVQSILFATYGSKRTRQECEIPKQILDKNAVNAWLYLARRLLIWDRLGEKIKIRQNLKFPHTKKFELGVHWFDLKIGQFSCT